MNKTARSLSVQQKMMNRVWEQLDKADRKFSQVMEAKRAPRPSGASDLTKKLLENHKSKK